MIIALLFYDFSHKFNISLHVCTMKYLVSSTHVHGFLTYAHALIIDYSS